MEMYNPNPTIPWCTVVEYPMDCSSDVGEDDTDLQCLRGDVKTRWILYTFIIIIGTVNLLTVTGCLLVVIIGQFIKPRYSIQRFSRQRVDNETSAIRKTLVQQAIMYESSSLIIWISSVFFLGSTGGHTDFATASSHTVVPLQGLINALIFFYHKVHNIRKANRREHISIWKALYYIFCSSSHANEIQLTGLSRIEGYYGEEHEEEGEFERQNDEDIERWRRVNTEQTNEESSLSNNLPVVDNFFPTIPLEKDESNGVDDWSRGQLGYSGKSENDYQPSKSQDASTNSFEDERQLLSPAGVVEEIGSLTGFSDILCSGVQQESENGNV